MTVVGWRLLYSKHFSSGLTLLEWLCGISGHFFGLPGMLRSTKAIDVRHDVSRRRHCHAVAEGSFSGVSFPVAADGAASQRDDVMSGRCSVPEDKQSLCLYSLFLRLCGSVTAWIFCSGAVAHGLLLLCFRFPGCERGDVQQSRRRVGW